MSYNSKPVLYVYLFFSEGTELYNCMLGQWALLAYIVIDLPTSNRVVETPSSVEAFNKA